MPSPKQPERGVRKPHQVRYRVNANPCTGLDLSHDPSTIDDTALRQAVNARVHDGIVLSRGGQASEATGMNGCVQGLVDVEGYGSRGVLAGIEDSGTKYATVDFFDENLALGSNYFTIDGLVVPHPPEGNRSGSNYEDSKARYCYTWWDGNIVFQWMQGSINPTLRTYPLCKLIVPDGDVSDIEKIQVEEIIPLTVPGEGSHFEVSSLLTLPPVSGTSSAPLYFGTMGGGVTAYVNGQLVRLLAEGTFTGRVVLFQYNNQVFAAGKHKVMYQSNGWSSGGTAVGTTWTNVAVPAGPTDFRPMCGIEHAGYGYIGGYDDATAGTAANSGYILKVDDSSGTPVITVDHNSYAGSDYLFSVDDFAVGIGGVLYAAFRAGTAFTLLGIVGVYDTDTPGLTNVFQVGESDAIVNRIQGTNAKIYISAWGDASGTGVWAYNGSSATKIAANTEEPSPYDMVLF